MTAERYAQFSSSSGRGDYPQGVIQIKLYPFRTDEFICPDEGLRQQLQGKACLLVADFVVRGDRT